jgi:PKD repeat protein
MRHWCLCLGVWLAAQSPFAFAQEIQVEQSVEPPTIFIKGVGQDPQIATIRLTLTGVPKPDKPLDIFILLDRSASHDLIIMKGIAREIITQLSAGDRVGIISFSETAELNLGLTLDTQQALSVVESLTPGKQTALGEALALAIDELGTSARAKALRGIIAPTDGISPVGRRAQLEAQRAGKSQLPIYPIGISQNVNRVLLNELAKLSGGVYFSRFNVQSAEGLFKKFGRPAAARFLRVVTTISPGATLESAYDKPQLRRGADGLLRAEWSFNLIIAGAVRALSYQVGASRTGTITVIQPPSFLEFTNARGEKTTQELAALSIEAKKEIRPPTADFVFAPDRAKVDAPVHFDAAASKDPDGKIVRYEWDWNGDGVFDETVTVPRITHMFTTSGEHRVVLQVTDDDGATAQISKIVPVEGISPRLPSQIKISPTSPSAGQLITFDASAATTDIGAQITLYEWDWESDGIFDAAVTTPTITHVFREPGEKRITLRITDSQGKTATFTFTILISGAITTPSVSFDVSQLATGDLQGEVPMPAWLDYYTRDGRVTDDELRDAATRYGIGVYVPGTRYVLSQRDLETLHQLNQFYKRVVLYQDVERARSDGYREVGSAVAQVGQLYVNESLLSGPLLATRVPVLLYAMGADGKLRLVGARFVALRPEDASLFGINNWPKIGEVSVLTVWLTANPKGVFANTNPNVR